MTESEMEAVIEGMEQAEDTRQDAEMIAEEEGILLFAEARQTARASDSATMVKGRKILLSRQPGKLLYLLFHGKWEDRILPGVCKGFPGYRELRRPDHRRESEPAESALLWLWRHRGCDCKLYAVLWRGFKVCVHPYRGQLFLLRHGWVCRMHDG